MISLPTRFVENQFLAWWNVMIATKIKNNLSQSDPKFNFEVTSVFPVNRHAIYFLYIWDINY